MLFASPSNCHVGQQEDSVFKKTTKWTGAWHSLWLMAEKGFSNRNVEGKERCPPPAGNSALSQWMWLNHISICGNYTSTNQRTPETLPSNSNPETKHTEGHGYLCHSGDAPLPTVRQQSTAEPFEGKRPGLTQCHQPMRNRL